MIEAQGLTKRYGDFTAVDGIDFTVARARHSAFSGRTARARVDDADDRRRVAPPAEGCASPAWPRARRRQIKGRLGVVPQEDNLDPDLDVGENLLVYARYFGLPRDESERRSTSCSGSSSSPTEGGAGSTRSRAA